jgi:hypothetical protein
VAAGPATEGVGVPLEEALGVDPAGWGGGDWRPSARSATPDRLAAAPREEVAKAWVVTEAVASMLGCGRLTALATE